ncbi:MAG TPA: hypothetical protein VGC76_05595 [Pyrinomonadaceae bacterium]|jgi:hypothetical protein
MRILIIVSVIFWLIVGFAFGQTSKKTVYKLRVKNNALVLSYQNKSHKLNLAKQIDAAKIDEAEVLFANRANNFTYLVIDVTGMSKEKSDDRQCGAGVESNLIWVKLNASWRVSAADSVLYESCWLPITSHDSFKISDDNLTLVYENLRNDTEITVSYNAAQPEKGFVKKTAAVNNQ